MRTYGLATCHSGLSLVPPVPRRIDLSRFLPPAFRP